MAAKEGLVFACDARFHAIILKLDAKGVVDLINATGVCLDRDDRILEEIDDLKSRFSLFYVGGNDAKVTRWLMMRRQNGGP